MKKSFLFTVLYSVLGLLCPALIQAQDIHVNCATVNPCTLTPAGGISWAQQNPVWIFAPSNPASSILIYLHNNNTTSAHTATVKVFQTGFAKFTVPTLTSNADFWVQDSVTQSSVASASCNSVAINAPGTPGASGMGTCYVASMYAAQVAIQITGTSLQAGSPDTYDLSIIQQPGYISGPQPGNDSSAGAFPIQAINPSLTGSDGAISANSAAFRLYNCANSSAVTPFACALINGIYLFGNANLERLRSVDASLNAGLGVAATGLIPSSVSTSGITPVVTAAVASNLVLKASAGNLYSVTITTGATAGLLMLFNATSAPADGAVTPVLCNEIAANSTVTVPYNPIPMAFATGMTVVFSSGTNCFNKTASATAFISGQVE